MKTEETITIAMPPNPGTAAPKKARASKSAAKPATKKSAKATAPKKRVAKTAASKKAARPAAKREPRADTKKAIVLELLRRKQGATTAEIAKATDWQKHSIRGFISGHVTKMMGLVVEATNNDAGERTYRIAK